MASASIRRKRNVAKRLAVLRRESPELFCLEWDRRLDAWALEADRRARQAQAAPELDPSRPSARRGFPDCFGLLTDALALLRACGGEQLASAVGGRPVNLARHTCDVLQDACRRAVARAWDPRLHRAGSTAAVCRGAEELGGRPR